MGDVIQYEHHGILVWGRAALRGKHQEFNLCSSCARYRVDPQHGCLLAKLIHFLNKTCDVTTPVFECAEYKE